MAAKIPAADPRPVRIPIQGSDSTTGDEWAALGRVLAAEDADAYASARDILRELVQRVRARNAKAAGMLGFRLRRPTA